MPGAKRIFRAGVRFDCPQCGKLWKDDSEHSPVLVGQCAACGGDLRMVGSGGEDPLIGDARWFRCLKCKALYMKRRGELLSSKPRAGFKEFTEF